MLYLVRNDSAQNVPVLGTYVAEGKQFQLAYERSQTPSPQPGATQVGCLAFVYAAPGGVISGYSFDPGNDRITLQVPG